MLNQIRKELLNLSLSNNLLKLRDFKAKGLDLIGIKSNLIFNYLIEEERILNFDLETADDYEDIVVKIPFTYNENKKHASIIANSNHKTVQKKLKNTYKEAKEFTDERGINSLYLSIGALKWYEDEKSEIELFAPLILIPVELLKSTDHGEDSFSLKFAEGNIEPNYTLERKLKHDFDINFPNYDYVENTYENIQEYFSHIKNSILKIKRWEVIEDKITLNLFSFLKIMMYHDLDDTKWNENNVPSNNQFISRLLSNSGDLSFQDYSQFEDINAIEDNISLVKDIGNILDADSSQIEAINLGLNKKCLVIKGPPGTGKSQTITNFIASCVEKNKKVLFVAEKLAALNVVKNRLDKVGLELTYLELHSHKANRKDVLDSINASLTAQTNRGLKDNNEIEKLEVEIANLNNYYDIIFSSVSGVLVYEMIAELVELKMNFPSLETISGIKDNWSKEEIHNLDKLVKQATEFTNNNGLIKNLPFYGIKNLQINFGVKEELTILFKKLQNCINQLNETYLEIKSVLGFSESLNLEKLKDLTTWISLLETSPRVELINIKETLECQTKLSILFKCGEELKEVEEKYEHIITKNAHVQNFYFEKSIYESKKDSFLKFLSGDLKKARLKLYSVLKSKPKSIQEEYEILEIIILKKEIIEQMEAMQSSVLHAFKAKYDFTKNFDWLAAKDEFQFVEKLYDFAEKSIFDTRKVLISAEIEFEKLKSAGMLLKSKNSELNNFNSEISTLLPNECITKELLNLPIEQVILKINGIVNNFDTINLTLEWNILRKNLIDNGGKEVLTYIETLEDKATNDSYPKWRKSLLICQLDKTNLNEIVNKDIALNADTFKELDLFFINKFNREKTKYKYLNSIPTYAALGEQMNILRAELIKKRRHMPLRKLLTKAGNTISTIKPVFMMSPLSVAQYLTPDEFNFDYVIFDEASQIKPVEAFGALLRGERAIIVGDDKQLPPSSFFDNVSENDETFDEENNNTVIDVDSVLDLFVARNAMHTMLNWHYRSKHESLIAISNKLYYESNLICLPSPNFSSGDNGLIFEHCPETIYSGQKNEKEAELIVERLISEIKKEPDPSKCSIGIVAFSIKQKDCIENIILIKRKINGELDRYLSAADKSSEPFFVKNLENVQGDERDIIIISICYGKNDEGKLNRRFGPVNNPGGEKRLNVLFTRAKEKCIVYSNFTAGDISVNETDPIGLKMLKAFLDYAQNRKLTTEYVGENRTDSPFEAGVKRQLERNGFEVHTQIGSAGYFIDLAIPHPNQKGRYILGIECDGAAFHGSKSARERDRLRQDVLEGLGWKIHRIWSTDWFRNPQKEVDKLLDIIAILNANNASQPKTNKHKSAEIDLPIIEIEEKKIDSIGKPYTQINLNTSKLFYEIHDVPIKDLVDVIKELVTAEAPIHSANIKHVITQKLGIGRIGGRIEDTFNNALKVGKKNGFWDIKSDFVYLNGQVVDFYRKRHSLPEKQKQIEWIAPEEIQLILTTTLAQAVTISKEELFKYVLSELNGGIRLTEGIYGVIDKEFKKLLSIGKIKIENEIVKM